MAGAEAAAWATSLSARGVQLRYGVRVSGGCGCTEARNHYRDKSDGLECRELLSKGDEADNGRDRRIHAVDDGDGARFEAAEAFELEREWDDQTAHRYHEPDGE